MSYYGCNRATESQNSVCTIEGDTFYIESSVGLGLSAYEIAVNDGFIGTEEQWLESLKANIPISPTDEGKFLSNDGFSVEWRVIDAESVVITPTPELPEDDVSDALFYLASNKVDKVVGKQLSTEDFTTGYKAKLDGVENDATKNSTDDFLLARENHTGTQSIATIELLQGVLDEKVDKVVGKQLSTEDFTTVLKTKLDGIAEGAQVNVATNLGVGTRTTTTVPITSSTGTAATLPAATTALAGVMVSADKTKLNGIAAGATVNQTDAFLLDRVNHTGTQAISTVAGLQTTLDTKVDKVAGKQLSTEDYTSAEKTKLSGIATGATANSTDSFLLDRANHTGTQAASTITGLGAVATSGAAGDVSISDAGNYFTGANVEVALQEVGAMIGDIGSALDLINGEAV